MNVNNTSIYKISAQQNDLFVIASWEQYENDLFHLKLFEGNNVWIGVLSKNLANEYREDADETEEEYFDNVKGALAGSDSTYVYNFSAEGNHATFSWKKTYRDGEAMLLHCSVLLHRETSATKNDLIDFLTKENNELEENIKDMNEKNEQLHLDLEKYKYELKKFTSINKDMENVLYKKFLLALNEEKMKICQYQDAIKALTE